MELTKSEQKIEIKGGKIIKSFVEEVEILEDEIEGEINMCQQRIAEAQERIASETQKWEMLKNVKKTIK